MNKTHILNAVALIPLPVFVYLFLIGELLARRATVDLGSALFLGYLLFMLVMGIKELKKGFK